MAFPVLNEVISSIHLKSVLRAGQPSRVKRPCERNDMVTENATIFEEFRCKSLQVPIEFSSKMSFFFSGAYVQFFHFSGKEPIRWH